MSDLISRQEAIDACHNYEDGKDAYAYGYVVEERLKTLPSAEPEIKCIAKVTLTDDQVKEAFEKAKGAILTVEPKRKKGKWIYEGKRGRFPACRCSECGNVENADWAILGDNVNYCPNCGADMRGER